MAGRCPHHVPVQAARGASRPSARPGRAAGSEERPPAPAGVSRGDPRGEGAQGRGRPCGQPAAPRAGGRAPRGGEAGERGRRFPPRQGERLRRRRRRRGLGGLRWAAAGGGAPLPRPHTPARPRRGPARPLRPLPRRHAQAQFLEEDGDGREAETRRAGEDRPLHPGGHAGGRHLRQSEG